VRVGILGGTFDPPHIGHLLAASDAVEALSLDQLVFIPNARQPLKADAPVAAAEDRLAMVRLLCAGDPRFMVDDTEVRRGGLSFTVETLREYRARAPAAALFLLIGADVVETLPSWRDPEAIAALAEVVVLIRSSDGTRPVPGSLDGVRQVATRRVDVSSTEIRARVRAGRRLTGFVPDAVAAYIAERGLYRTNDAAGAGEGNES